MLEFAVKTHCGREVPLQDWLTLGREPECGLVLHGEQIADRHARIERRDDGWMLKDLRSPDGTWLNGTRIHEAFLNDGDWIRCGTEEILFFHRNPVDQGFPQTSRNPEWQDLLQGLDNVARTDYPVLLLGPSGTGKDVLAQNLHGRSHRSQGNFVSVNCSALTETLVESELFGHVKGSFTGAITDRKGAFEAARGGTLFLDEIGDLPYTLQAKLLRALENSEIRPVGSDRTIKTNVRVIAATHQNLAEKIEEGVFRSDLFYRLNVVTVQAPALVERMEDFDDLLYQFARQMRVRFSVFAILRLKKHGWPGNIRELRNLVARASALYPKQTIEEAHIERLLTPARSSIDLSAGSSADGTNGETLPVIKEIERQMILKRLKANKGNQRRTAQDLGIPKSTLHDRLKAYQINPLNFKV